MNNTVGSAFHGGREFRNVWDAREKRVVATCRPDGS
jgi:hypothetical protein